MAPICPQRPQALLIARPPYTACEEAPNRSSSGQHVWNKPLHASGTSPAVQDEKAKQQAQRRFQQLKAAYEVLKDPELRQQYDRGQHVAL